MASLSYISLNRVTTGYHVPAILEGMRQALVAQNALYQEGIFRLAGDQNEMKVIKNEMNRTKVFNAKDADMNTIANLLKVFPRTLPAPTPVNEQPNTLVSQIGVVS